jgi:hypothetical protein
VSAHERERLSAYLDGELAEGESAAVRVHLGACAECSAFLAQLAAVDEAAAALPAEAPDGYFESFPARVRARLSRLDAASPARRVPVWTWAAAAALLLAVATPLTLQKPRRTLEDQSPPLAAQPTPAGAGSNIAAPSSVPEARTAAAPPARPREKPKAPVAVARPPAAQAVVPPAAGAVAPRDEAEALRFSREPAAPPAPERDLGRQDVLADVEAQRAIGVPTEDAPKRERAERAAPRSATTAEEPFAALSAAGAGREATPAGFEELDAFRRLDAERPRSAAGWRRLREQWSALAAAEADAGRADEARVRAIVAAREAWRAGGDEGDEAAFRADAESYLLRADARQKARVEALLAGP